MYVNFQVSDILLLCTYMYLLFSLQLSTCYLNL